MNSLSLKSKSALSALALLLPFAGSTQLLASPSDQNQPPSAQSNASGGAAALSCKLGSKAVITNNGPTLQPGTKIIISFNPPPSVIGSTTQRIVYLKAELASGADATFPAQQSGIYQDCSAKVA